MPGEESAAEKAEGRKRSTRSAVFASRRWIGLAVAAVTMLAFYGRLADASLTLRVGAIAAGCLLIAALAYPWDAKFLSLVLIAAIFVPLLKPLTGVRELMLVPDVILYIVICVSIFGILKIKLDGLAWIGLGCFAFFFCLAGIAVFHSNVPSIAVGLEGFRKTAFASVAFLIAFLHFRSAKDLDFLVRGFLIAGSIAALYGIKQALWWTDFDTAIVESNAAGHWTAYGWGRYRSVGFFSGPFHLGILGVQLVCVARVFGTGWGTRPGISARLGSLAWIANALGAGAVVVSQTRTNYVILAVLAPLFFLFTFRSYRELFYLQLFGTAAIFAAIIWIASGGESASATILRTIADPLSDDRFLRRFDAMGEIWAAIRLHPFVGYGMGSAGDALGASFPPTHTYFTSHNLALKLLLEIGVFGLIAFAGIILAWLGRMGSSRTNHFRDPAAWRFQLLLAAWIAPVLLNGALGSAIEAYPMNLYFWFALGAALTIGAGAKSEARDLPG